MSDAASDQPATVSDHDAPTTVATAPVSVEQAAAILGVSVTTVRRRIRDGSIRAEEARRPQGPVWLVYLPPDATPPTTSDQPATSSDHGTATAVATAPTTADAMVTYTRTLLAPLLEALELSQQRLEQSEARARDQAETIGRLSERLDPLTAERDALRAELAAARAYADALQAQQEARETANAPEAPQEPEIGMLDASGATDGPEPITGASEPSTAPEGSTVVDPPWWRRWLWPTLRVTIALAGAGTLLTLPG